MKKIKREPILCRDERGEFYKIPLASNRGFALVDKTDFHIVSAYNWAFSKGYAVRGTWHRVLGKKKTNHFMHREILRVRKRWVDHKDGDGLNNRRHNLRIASPSQNHANRRKSRCKGSKYKGVRLQPYGKWSARIVVKGKETWLGTFETDRAAAEAYDKAAIRAWGEFARTNL